MCTVKFCIDTGDSYNHIVVQTNPYMSGLLTHEITNAYYGLINPAELNAVLAANAVPLLEGMISAIEHNMDIIKSKSTIKPNLTYLAVLDFIHRLTRLSKQHSKCTIRVCP